MKTIFLFFAIIFFTLNTFSQSFWTPTNGPYGGRVRAFAINEQNQMFAAIREKGIFTSTNSGLTWYETSNGLTNFNFNEIISKNNYVFLCTSSGIFRKTPNDTNWTAINTGLSSLNASSIFATTDNILWLAVKGSGVFKSTDLGNQWTQFDAGIFNKNITSFCENNGILYAGSKGNGMFVSTNQGVTWTNKVNGLSFFQVSSLASFQNTVFAATDGGVYYSNNNGEFWFSKAGGINYEAVKTLIIKDSTIFAGTEKGIFKVNISSHDTTRWTAVNNGLYNLNINKLYAKNGKLFAATEGNGVFVSENNGQNWTPLQNEMCGLSVIEMVNTENSLFAATEEGGIFKSTNIGDNWEYFSNGLTQKEISSIVKFNNQIFSASRDSGIFVLQNSQWVNIGLKDTFVMKLLTTNTNLFAVTYNFGVFKYQNSQWIPTNNGITASVLQSCYAKNDSLICASATQIFLSTNNGQNWQNISQGIGSEVTSIYALLIHNETLFAGTNFGLYKCSTQNFQWHKVGQLISAQIIISFFQKENEIFAGTYYGGIYYSPNNGESWRSFNTNLKILRVYSFGLQNIHLFAGTQKGVWRYNRLAVAPQKPQGDTLFCQRTDSTVYFTNISENCSYYIWEFSPQEAGNLVQNDTSATIFWNSEYYGKAKIKVKGGNGSGQSAFSDSLNIEISPFPLIPSKPRGDTAFCIDAPNAIFQVDSCEFADGYIWFITEGIGSFTYLDSLKSKVEVDWFKNFYGQAKFFVRPFNECGIGDFFSDTFIVNVYRGAAKPTSPTGIDNVCQNSANSQYSVMKVENATDYVWNIFPIHAGNLKTDSNRVEVNWNNQFVGAAFLSVKALYKGCGGESSDSLRISVKGLPARANSPTGKTQFCINPSDTVYFSESISNTTSYLWYISPEEAGILTGNSNSVSVNWKNDYLGKAYLCLKAHNSCGDGEISAPLEVTILSLPPIPTIRQDSNLLISSATDGNQWYDSTGIITGERKNTYKITQAGKYWVTVTTDGCTSESSVNYYPFYKPYINVESLEVASEIQIFPVPCNEICFLRFSNVIEIYSVKLFSVSGKEIEISQEKRHGEYQISLQNVAKGFYFLEILTDKGKVFRKILKN